jgi:hypothetical protein
LEKYCQPTVLDMAQFTIEVSVMAAEELQNTSKFGKMSVYAVLWVDPAMKKCTRVLHKAGKNPVWNDRVSLSLVNPTLLSYPHSTLTVQVSHHRPHLTYATLYCVPVGLRFFFFEALDYFGIFLTPLQRASFSVCLHVLRVGRCSATVE